MPLRDMDREQMWLLPPSLDELLPLDHPARFVAVFVDALDKEGWAELGVEIDGDPLGAPAYHPRALLCVWLYGFMTNRKRVQRLMRTMGLAAIYRRPRTSQPVPGHKVYHYLLCGVEINRVNQAWTADITYIPMAKGFLYVVAIMDWYSRYVLSWRVSNTLEADFCVDALEEALSKGKPEVFNTDQGSQFTSEAFTGLLEQHGVRVSMDGKGRYTDNLFIERLWRSLKYEEVYLKAYTGGRDARIGIGEYFRFYNTERPHQALEYQTPAEVFISNNHVVTQGNDVQSGNPLTSLEALEAAGPALNMAPILSN